MQSQLDLTRAQLWFICEYLETKRLEAEEVVQEKQEEEMSSNLDAFIEKVKAHGKKVNSDGDYRHP